MQKNYIYVNIFKTAGWVTQIFPLLLWPHVASEEKNNKNDGEKYFFLQSESGCTHMIPTVISVVFVLISDQGISDNKLQT